MKQVYAIIPARSGSKGLKDKNIMNVGGIPLLGHSIRFAKKLKCVDRIFCSTDSQMYSEIAKEYGAEVPFLRAPEASSDNSMEDVVLKDLRLQFMNHNIEEPFAVVWLRPTFIFRNIMDVNMCIDAVLNGKYSAARTVVRAENRLYSLDGFRLSPNFPDDGKSMIRRQDMIPSYKVYSTDVIKFKNNSFEKDFLGRNIFAKETSEICGFDIDNIMDFKVVKSIYESGLFTNELNDLLNEM